MHRRVHSSLLTKSVERIVLDSAPSASSATSSATVTTTAAHSTTTHRDVFRASIDDAAARQLAAMDSAFPSGGMSPDRTPPSPYPSPANMVGAGIGALRSVMTSNGTAVVVPLSPGSKLNNHPNMTTPYKASHDAFERMCRFNSQRHSRTRALAQTAQGTGLGPLFKKLDQSPGWSPFVAGSPDSGAAASVAATPTSRTNGPAFPLAGHSAADFGISVNWDGTEAPTVFHSSVLPNIALADLGIMIAAQIPHCPAEMTLAALVLARRYCSMTATQPTAHMMHRLYLACLQLAIKAHCDHFVSSQDFARISGLSRKEMYRLEKHVLNGIEWRAQVARAETQHLLEAATDRRQLSMDQEVSWEALLSTKALHHQAPPAVTFAGAARHNSL